MYIIFMKINKKVIKQIEKEAKKYFKNAHGCHDWTHVERVRNLALNIGRKEHADPHIIEVAALLHDIAKNKEISNRGQLCHAESGALEAAKLLKKHKIDQDLIGRVAHCIISHRFRNKHQPRTIEAKALQDADRIDALGAIGVARDFLFAGNSGSNTLYTGREKKLAKSKKDYSYTKEDSAVLEYEIKLKHLSKLLLTETGKKIGKERSGFMNMFFKRFWEEVGGEK